MFLKYFWSFQVKKILNFLAVQLVVFMFLQPNDGIRAKDRAKTAPFTTTQVMPLLSASGHNICFLGLIF